MQNKPKIKIAIVGASGYTGVELIRLLINHPQAQIKELIANNSAGQEIANIYPHLLPFVLPILKKIEEVDFSEIDLVFCCLPHTTAQINVKQLLDNKNYHHLRIIDLSADFRLNNAEDYQKWYNQPHAALELQKEAIYGLSEINRQQIKKAKLIANPGCYPTSALLPLLPLIEAGLIEAEGIIIDSKSSISGAGRNVKLENLYCEINETIKVYGIPNHRHTAEIEQEINNSWQAQQKMLENLESQSQKNNPKIEEKIKISFTPHLLPINRGIISTIYCQIKNPFQVSDLKNCLSTKYQDEYFVNCNQNYPSTKDVAGSNFCHIAVYPSRLDNQAIIVCAIDNLVKGASGQAIQNMNIMFGIEEKMGLTVMPTMP